MASERLKKMDQAKKTARKAQNQVKFTIEIAESRREWSEPARWEELRRYSNVIAMDYCRKRGVPNYESIAEEGLSEAWRYVCNGEKAERAIVKAIDLLTQTAKSLKAQSKPLPEVPAHSEAYHDGEAVVLAIVRSLPERLRPLAILLSQGMENNCEIAEILQVSEFTIRNHRGQLRKWLASRYQSEVKRDFLQWLRGLTENTLDPCRMVLAALPLHEWLANIDHDSN